MPWWGSNKPKLLEAAEFSIIEQITITPKELGRGSYGTVYAAVLDGKPCVTKELHPHLSHQSDGQNIIKEINTLSTLKHPSIVQFLGVYFRDKSHVPILVMERMWMSLFALLEEQPNELPLLIKTHILYDVACGLQYLHSQKKPVVHRDLNANNILLTKSLEAKIADLGQAKALENFGVQKLSTAPGNLSHMAPETLTHNPTYDSKLDIFSFGCTALHFVTEKFPTATDQFVQSGEDQNAFVKVTEVERREKFIKMMASSSALLQLIVLHCLHDEPSSRPTIDYVSDELKKYINKLENEPTGAAQQYIKDKVSIIKSFQSQALELDVYIKLVDELSQEKIKNVEHLAKKENHIIVLKSQINDLQNKLEQSENDVASIEEKRKILQEDLSKQNAVHKQVTTAYHVQQNRLREDLKLKQEEVETAIQQQQCLQIELDDQQLDLSIKNQKISSLEEQVHELSSAVREGEHNLKVIIANCAEKEEKILHLSKKLEEKDHMLNETDECLKDYKSKCHLLHQKHAELKQKIQQQEVSQLPLQMTKKVTDPGTKLHQHLVELQYITENKHQKLQENQLLYTSAYKFQDTKVKAIQTQHSELKNKSVIQKQQLEEKSYRLSTLESSLNELQESLHSREEKLKTLEEENSILVKLVESNDKSQRNLEENFKSKEESLRQKEKELQLQKKEHADELNKLHAQHLRQTEDLHKDNEMYRAQIAGQGGISKLLEEETQYKVDLAKNIEEKLKKQENEIKSLLKEQKDFKRQIKHHEVNIKDKLKYIEKLEKKSFDVHSRYYFSVTWHPYMSLPVNRVRASAVAMKDKAFVSGGYLRAHPQGEDMVSYLKLLEKDNDIFCFHTKKCRCDSIASPVVLGGVASVNGQCVLVSGAEGNTLTGNVYVLCEEGSDGQWKKFSEPVPTPRILPCVCCYGERWMIVCGGYACKEGSNLLETVNVMEILDTTKGEWYTLPVEKYPDVSTILSCTEVGEDLHIIGDGNIFKCNSNKLITAVTKQSEDSMPLWSKIDIQTEALSADLHPFSVVDVNGEPMIIASISGSEDDVTCVLMKDTTDTWRKMSEAVECQHCSAVVVTPTLELLLFGGSEKVLTDIATNMSQKGTVIQILSACGK